MKLIKTNMTIVSRWNLYHQQREMVNEDEPNLYDNVNDETEYRGVDIHDNYP